MQRKWKIIIGAAVAILVIGFVVFNSSRGLEANLLEIKSGPIAKTFEEDGEVVSEMQREIYSPFNGKIEELFVVEGQSVNKGDLLARVDDTELKLQLEGLKAQLASGSLSELSVEQARIQLVAAEKDYERINQLYDEGVVTRKELEMAENQLEAARSSLQRQQSYSDESKDAIGSQIALLQKHINQCKITSPLGGIVSNLAIKEGQVVGAAMPMMTVFKEGAYEVETYVLTDNIGYVAEGAEVELVLEKDDGDIHFFGKVTEVAPSAIDAVSPLGLQEKRVKVTIKPETIHKTDLRPGYEVKVTFTANRLDGKFVVPKTALFPLTDGEALWVVRGGRACVQPVKTGFDSGKDIVVDEGLDEGDLVILTPQLKGLKEGKKILAK